MLILLAGTAIHAQSGTLVELVSWMSGTFSNTAQAQQDTNYYAITLVMTPIWESRFPGQHWLYVEQALSSRKDQPYRQRIYQVEELENGMFRSAVYLVPDESDAIGKSTNVSFFDQWEPEDLDLREGCAVILSWSGGAYTGSTQGTTCSSSLRGATYTTSVVTIDPNQIISWDRGFDQEGKQVWGADKGGYVFIRQQNGAE